MLVQVFQDNTNIAILRTICHISAYIPIYHRRKNENAQVLGAWASPELAGAEAYLLANLWPASASFRPSIIGGKLSTSSASPRALRTSRTTSSGKRKLTDKD